jgi:pimeloyl-ACP methyl ester carboxylesterase
MMMGVGSSGDDDYFSSDLDDKFIARVWGRFRQPVMILHSAADEFVPRTVSQEELNAKWAAKNALISPLSGLIPGANHTVLGEDARQWLAVRVHEFLKTLNQ